MNDADSNDVLPSMSSRRELYLHCYHIYAKQDSYGATESEEAFNATTVSYSSRSIFRVS